MIEERFVIGDETKEKVRPSYSRKQKLIWIFAGIPAIALLVMLLHLRGFKDYTVKASYKRGEATETTYVGFRGNLLKYSRDGAFYTKYNGDLIWNYTYEMSNPKMDVCDNYILIYDAKGTQAAILTNTGFKQNIKTAMPIVDANITKTGVVAILMQEKDTGYIQLCDVNGNTIASGELHMENSGYPMALDISDSGEKMVVSQLDLNGGSIKSTIAFYDFGKVGQDKIDNLVATYSFLDQMFPQVEFLENEKVVAFGDGEIVLFDNNAKASIAKEIFIEGEIKSVICDNKYFGTICSRTNEEGKVFDEMTIYSSGGFKKNQKAISIPYNKVEFLSNHEVCFTNGKEVLIYNLYGIKKLAYTFETSIYKIIPGDTFRRYYFVKEDNIESVRLK